VNLFIQIPCYNEEQTLAITLADLPRQLPGIDDIKWVVIDDGSTDRTAAIAKQNGADYIVSHTQNLGLAKAFMSGLHICLKNGADIILNTDADNQYSAKSIPDLIQPIIERRADLVIGARPISEISYFSPLKKFFQRLGSWVVRIASNTDIPDAPSGFRALSRELALRVNVFNKFTYTLETIIQAGQKNFAVTWVPITTNEWLRPSRLVTSVPAYIQASLVTIIRIFVVYRPFVFFMSIGVTFTCAGLLIFLRFLIFYIGGDGDGHVQSLILAAVMIGIGFQVGVLAFVADLLSVNRQLLEEIQYKNRSDDVG